MPVLQQISRIGPQLLAVVWVCRPFEQLHLHNPLVSRWLQKELGIEAAPKPRPVREKRPTKSLEEEDDEDEEQDEDTWAE